MPLVVIADLIRNLLRYMTTFFLHIIKTRHCVSGCDRVVPSGLCLADMPSVCKDQQPCHAILSVHVIPTLVCGELGIYGQKASRHLWLRHYFLIKHYPFRRQQVFLPWMARRVWIKQTDETFGNGGIQMVFNEVGSVF